MIVAENLVFVLCLSNPLNSLFGCKFGEARPSAYLTVAPLASHLPHQHLLNAMQMEGNDSS